MKSLISEIFTLFPDEGELFDLQK